MQCFRVGYRGIWQALLVFSVHTRALTTLHVSLPKSSENVRKFSEELGNLKINEIFGKSLVIFRNFWKTSERVKNGFKIWGKSSGVFGIFRNFQKWFKSVFQMIL